MSRMGFVCSSYAKAAKPSDCLTAGQRLARARAARTAARAEAKAAAKQARLDAKARAKRAALAAARARRRAAEVAAANAWHAGYLQQDGNVYWKWINGGSCQDYAQYGCWHIQVITAYGCSSYVGVNANEYAGGAIINGLLANQGSGIPPRTPRLFELDADQTGVTANDVKVDCN
jgi:multidrug efflux pump subunit AcrA (membrane-fusion protein)